MVGEGQILSTDDYFYENGIYSHDVTKLTDAHEWNRKRGKILNKQFLCLFCKQFLNYELKNSATEIFYSILT